MKYLLVVGLISMLISLNGALAFSEELVLSADSAPTFNVGVYPSISGNVTGSQGEPISNVYVYALFPSKTVEAMTNSNGKFLLNPLTSYPVGEYSIDVYARSETVLSRTTITFEIVESSNQEKSEWLTNNTYQIGIISQTTLENQQNTTQHKEIQNDTLNFVDQQRRQSQINLEQDLAENGRDLQKNQNRSAFANFVAGLDSIMHAIFWDQFDFTQKISDDAYKAKLDALEHGKNSQEAMKVYQEEAAVSRTDVYQYMKELNIKHGFTNSTVQEQFDENGKIPRNNGN